MTLVEFISPLKNSTHRNRILAVLYFKHRYGGQEALTIDQVRQALRDARVKKWSGVNIPDVVAKSGHYVDSPGTNGTVRLWKLTSSGFDYVRDLLGLPSSEPEIEHDVGTLTTVTSKIKDAETKNYVEEAVKCLQVGALRACVVFIWAGAVRVIHSEILTYGVNERNTAIQKHYPKARGVNKLDDFSYIKDKVSLSAAVDLKFLDKSQKDTLEEALNLRNRCGHPGKYKPGVKKVSSMIEDVVSILFS